MNTLEEKQKKVQVSLFGKKCYRVEEGNHFMLRVSKNFCTRTASPVQL